MTQERMTAGQTPQSLLDGGAAPGGLHLECDDRGRIALRFADGVSHPDVRVRRAAPLSDPEHYVVFLDAQERELCVVRDPGCLSAESQAIVKSALERHYLTSQVTRVVSLRVEADVCYFEAETSRGRREFVVANLQEGLRRLGDRKVLFVDVDGNRFEIADVERLDRHSAALLGRVL